LYIWKEEYTFQTTKELGEDSEGKL